MKYRLFQYSLPAPPELEDLNAFLQSQRVATVAHHVANTSGGTMLIFVVETVAGASNSKSFPEKVDYREKLNDGEFAVFSRLREVRKKWAEAEGVPVYTVFTNVQLAEMVQRRVKTTAELQQIEGIGTSRIEKYGVQILAILKEMASKTPLPGGLA